MPPSARRLTAFCLTLACLLSPFRPPAASAAPPSLAHSFGPCPATITPPTWLTITRTNLFPQNHLRNARPLRKGADGSILGDLLAEICIQPVATPSPCPDDPGVDYHLTFSHDGRVIERITADAGGCRYLWRGPRRAVGTDYRSSPGFWALLADALHVNMAQLFPHRI